MFYVFLSKKKVLRIVIENFNYKDMSLDFFYWFYVLLLKNLIIKICLINIFI